MPDIFDRAAGHRAARGYADAARRKEPKVNVCIRLDEQLHRDLKAAAAANGTKMSAVLEHAARAYVEEHRA